MKKLTPWQQLTQILSPSLNLASSIEDAKFSNIQNQEQQIQLSPEEEYVRMLDAKQGKVLANQHIKATSSILNNPYYQNTSANRVFAYADYDSMCFYPIIGAVVDIIAEECVTVGNNNKILTVFSNKERIKNELEDLFYNKLDINSNIFYWVRSVVKYGDCFLYLISMKGDGVKGVIQLPISEMERDEKVDKDKVVKTEFKRLNTNETYNIFQVAHFRLLSDDKYLPYGTSIIDKARRTVKQLVMVEDAMLMYRIERAPERRVFKIDVGNIEPNDIAPYMQKITTHFKKQTQVAKDGKISHRYDPPHSTEDYFVPVRNAQNSTVIDTLPGAQNLDAISDITYLRDNLVTALGVPASFISYGEATGDGKNLAMADVRFAKKINRIQQAIIQELNKIAIIHLHLRGFGNEDIENFTLTLTNPSIQGEILKIETMKAKMDLFVQAVTKVEGMAPMSFTKAKKDILGWTDNEIKQDAIEQAFEEVIKAEIAGITSKIKKSGLFNDLLKRYKPLPFEKDLQIISGDATDEEGVEGEETPSGDFGGSSELGGASDFGTGEDFTSLEDSGETPDAEASTTNPLPIATNINVGTEPVSETLLVESNKLNSEMFKLLKELDRKINE